MATTTLSNYAAPTINDIAARRIFSETILQNIYQGLIESDGEGITQRFSRDVSGAQIRIVRVKPVKQFARRLGAAVNGGNFPLHAYENATDSFGLDVLDVLDTPIDIANVSKEMIPVGLAAESIKSYSDQVNAALNAVTIAGKYYATFLKQANGNEVNVTEFNGSDLYLATITANGLLDEGDEDMDVAMFPQEGRCYVLQTKYRPVLIKQGVLVVGGANDAYRIVEGGTVSAGTRPTKIENGFIGTVDGVRVHIAAPLYFKLAAEYLGLTKGDLTQAVGYISSNFANVRGVAAPNEIKVIDHPDGQGIRIQPLVRWGFTVLPGYEKGNSFIMENGYVNPYKALKEKVFTDKLDLGIFEVNPIGSRISLDADSLIATAATGKITVTAPTGSLIAAVLDDGKAVDSVAKFATAFAADTTNHAILTSGTPSTVAGFSGKNVAVLIVASDGTCYLTHVLSK